MSVPTFQSYDWFLSRAYDHVRSKIEDVLETDDFLVSFKDDENDFILIEDGDQFGDILEENRNGDDISVRLYVKT